MSKVANGPPHNSPASSGVDAAVASGVTDQMLKPANRLRRRERWWWGLVWWVSTLAWLWYRVSGLVLGTRHPRCHALLKRFWQWVFRVKGMMVVMMTPPVAAVQGRLIVYPRAHDYDAGLLMQVLPPGVLFPLPDPWCRFRLFRSLPSPPWGRMMQRFSYPDLGSTVQYHVIKTLLKRGYSVAVPLNPVPQVGSKDVVLGVEPGVMALMTEQEDVWVMAFTALGLFTEGSVDVTVPLCVSVWPLNHYVLPQQVDSDEGLSVLAMVCGYQQAIRLPTPPGIPPTQ